MLPDTTEKFIFTLDKIKESDFIKCDLNALESLLGLECNKTDIINYYVQRCNTIRNNFMEYGLFDRNNIRCFILKMARVYKSEKKFNDFIEDFICENIPIDNDNRLTLFYLFSLYFINDILKPAINRRISILKELINKMVSEIDYKEVVNGFYDDELIITKYDTLIFDPILDFPQEQEDSRTNGAEEEQEQQQSKKKQKIKRKTKKQRRAEEKQRDTIEKQEIERDTIEKQEIEDYLPLDNFYEWK